MKLLEKLIKIWDGSDNPFLIHNDIELRFSQIYYYKTIDLSFIQKGDIVALIGDFDPVSIKILINLIEVAAIVVPLTKANLNQHESFFEIACVDYIIEENCIISRPNNNKNEIIQEFREIGHPGLILFTSGTTGNPKAILHDMNNFLKRFETKRPSFRTLNFLLFDHIGGLNTLFHTLFNKGVVISPMTRSIDSILDICHKFNVEVLPTTPTFLRLLLISGVIPDKFPDSIKIITYGTERMDQSTLSKLCSLLPHIDLRQTYGMSELGIVRVKSESRDSLYMKIGGEGIETKVEENVLYIRATNRMIGYLNAASPFDIEGWYCTKDVVEKKGDYYKITGRTSEEVNVGGLKFMASEVENLVMNYPNISMVKAIAKDNPITGQHLELEVQPLDGKEIDITKLMSYLKEQLEGFKVPKRIVIQDSKISHRFKRL